MPTEKPDNWDELEEGTREDAQVDSEAERHYFEANGKRYWFDLRQPTWKKKNEIVSDSLKIEEGGADLRVDDYYLDMLEYMIEDMSVEGDSVRMFLVGLGPELGTQLQDAAPKPGQGLTEDEEGKSDEPSEASTEDGSPTPA